MKGHFGQVGQFSSSFLGSRRRRGEEKRRLSENDTGVGGEAVSLDPPPPVYMLLWMDVWCGFASSSSPIDTHSIVVKEKRGSGKVILHF